MSLERGTDLSGMASADYVKSLIDSYEDKYLGTPDARAWDTEPPVVSRYPSLTSVESEDLADGSTPRALVDNQRGAGGQRPVHKAAISSGGGTVESKRPERTWTAPLSKHAGTAQNKVVIGGSSSKPKKKGKGKGGPKIQPTRKVKSNDLMLSRALDNPVVKSFGAVSGQAKELRVSATDFLDYEATTAKPVLNYVFKDKQSYFASGSLGGVAENVARLEKVEVWALPRASNAAIATTSYASLYSTPAFNKGDGVSGAQPRQTSQRTTMVNPTFNTRWIKLGHTDFRKVFSDVVVTPIEVVEDDENTGLLAFQLFLIDPDSSTAYLDKVQLRVKTTWVQTLPVETTAQIGRRYEDSFSTIPATIAFISEFTITELKSIVDRS